MQKNILAQVVDLLTPAILPVGFECENLHFLENKLEEMRHVLPAMFVTAEPGALVQRLCASDAPVEELVFAWFLRRRCERLR
jgi:hypothetical protein